MKKRIALLLSFLIWIIPCTALAEPSATQTVQPSAQASSTASVDPVSAASAAVEAAIAQASASASAAAVAAAASAAPDVQAPEFDASCFNDTMTGMMMNADTGEVLFSQNADQIIYPASTTKIMTGLLAIELNGGTLDGEITLGPEVNEFGSSSSLMGVQQNHTVSIKDLLYGLMLCSGNDAAAALAVNFGGSVNGFVELMNQKAQQLGMTNTHFANPHGLKMQGQDHHSTARDMATLAQAAYQNPLLMEIMGTASYTVESTELNPNVKTSQTITNGNYLIGVPENEELRVKYAPYLYDPATGMKTGLLQNVDGNSNYGCLVASASKDGINLIATIFADTSDYGDKRVAMDRWDATIALFEYGFGRYVQVDLSQYITPVTLSEQLTDYAANDPQEGMLTITSGEIDALPGTKTLEKVVADGLADGTVQVLAEPVFTRTLSAPVTQGEQIGEVVYSLNGERLCTAALLAARTVYQTGQEQMTREEYDLPGPALSFELWWLWIIIPAAAVGSLFLIRAINLGRRKKRRSGRYYGYRAYPYIKKGGADEPERDRYARSDRYQSRSDRTRRKL